MRGDVAMSGNLGYELDLTRLTEAEKIAVKAQVVRYKEIRKLIQFGDFYRLKSPFEGNETAWLFVNKDKSEVIVYLFRVLAEPNAAIGSVRLTGIDKTKKYELLGTDKVYGGDELTFAGLSIPIDMKGDFQSHVWHFKEL
jgi:alpha-galactosidase